MNNETARLRQQLPAHLTPAKNRGFFLCPLCGSGQGKNQTGALHLAEDKLHAKCFACGFYGDIFDLVAREYALEGAAVFEKTREILGEAPGVSALQAGQTHKKTTANTLQKKLTPVPDFLVYLRRCALALPQNAPPLAYLHARGFTDETISKYALGYDEEAHQLVIPYGDTGYFIRRSVGEEKQFFKPPTATAGQEPLFGGENLYAANVDCVFVVESQLCAISLWQVGAAAVALGGGGTGRLLSLLKEKPPQAVLALALDNDEQGRQMEEKLSASVKALGLPCQKVNPAGPYKDPNEALQREPATFAQRVAACREEGLAAAQVAEETERAAYLETSAAGQLPAFLAELDARAAQAMYSTGFPALDEALGGGLQPGLYILGALSSLGKTTFVLQLADQLALAGREVLFFSLEMARHELMAKSLSRLQWELAGGESANTLPARTLLAGHWRQKKTHPLAEKALRQYQAYAHNLFFVEGGANMTVAALWEAAEKHRRLRGQAPVVVVDYLQILAPLEMRATDKQNTDRAVFELKRLSREMRCPVLAISSLNRENYTARMSMAAFKESGAIEYSSDVLLGLQFRLPPGAEKLSQEVLDEMKKKSPRQLELKILKNRSGPAGGSVAFAYHPRHDCFAQEERGGEGRR